MNPHCHICGGPHSEHLHEIKLDLRRWFRDQVTMSLQPVVKAAAKLSPEGSNVFGQPRPTDLARSKKKKL